VCQGVLFYTLDWANAAPPNTGTVVSSPVQATTTGAGNPVEVTVSSTFAGSASASFGNRTVVSPVGGLGQAGLYLVIAAGSGQAHRQDLTLTFSRPVTNLHFSITDIDWRNFDRVSASVPPTSQSKPGTVVGTGTSSDPWRDSSPGDINLDVNDNRGNVELTFAASLSSITISMWSQNGFWPDIYIAGLDFNANCM